jgi:hypothetical protein
MRNPVLEPGGRRFESAGRAISAWHIFDLLEYRVPRLPLLGYG